MPAPTMTAAARKDAQVKLTQALLWGWEFWFIGDLRQF
jgi:hypothetical protein